MKVLKRCQRLDEDGKRCKSHSVKLYTFHGDPELRSYDEDDTGWVCVYLCKTHAMSTLY